MALVQLNFQSYYLEGNTEVSVILPDYPIWTPEKAGPPKQYYTNQKNTRCCGFYTERTAIIPIGCANPTSNCTPPSGI